MGATTQHDPFGPPTRWTLVQRAAGLVPDADTETAWRELVERYRQPVTRAIHRHLYGHPDVEEICDDFYAYLFEQKVLPRVDPEQGKFRCFILGVVRNYSLHARRQRKAQEQEMPEELEPGGFEAEGAVIREEERDWASGVLMRATDRLLDKHERDGRLLLRAYGLPPFEPTPREDLAREAGIKRNALDQALFKTRKRLRELILEEIRHTVASPRDLEEEMDMVAQRLIDAHPGLLE